MKKRKEAELFKTVQKRLEDAAAKSAGMSDEPTAEESAAFAEGLLALAKSEAFKELQKRWFAPQAEGEERSPVPEDYHGDIAEYTLLAAELHEQRLGAVRALTLRFDAARRDEVQPFLDIRFDGAEVSVELGELWDSPFELGKRGKECGIMAESVWFDYVEAAPPEDIPVMAEAVRRAAVEKYPQAEVMVSIET